MANVRGRWFDKKLVKDEQTNLYIYHGGGSAIVPAFMILDFKITKKLFDYFEFSAGVNNMADVRYYPFGQIKGREYFAGLNFNVK